MTHFHETITARENHASVMSFTAGSKITTPDDATAFSDIANQYIAAKKATDGRRLLVIDMGNIEFFSAEALAAFVLTNKKLVEQGDRMVLTNITNPGITELFQVTKVDRLIEISTDPVEKLVPPHVKLSNGVNPPVSKIVKRNDAFIIHFEEETQLSGDGANAALKTAFAATNAGKTVVLDMSTVTYIDSTAIGQLIHAHRQATHNGGALVLAGLQHEVETILESTQLLNYFHAAANVDQAIKKYEARPGTEASDITHTGRSDDTVIARRRS